MTPNTQPHRACNIHLEDRAAWDDFLSTATKAEITEQLGYMLALEARLSKKAIPCLHVSETYSIGVEAFEDRFGTPYVPF